MAYFDEKTGEYLATVHDLDAITNDIFDIREQTIILNNRVDDSVVKLGYAEPVLDAASGIIGKVYELEENVDQIKQVLLDVQDMLRRLGLDEMENKVGDLNVLLQ